MSRATAGFSATTASTDAPLLEAASRPPSRPTSRVLSLSSPAPIASHLIPAPATSPLPAPLRSGSLGTFFLILRGRHGALLSHPTWGGSLPCLRGAYPSPPVKFSLSLLASHFLRGAAPPCRGVLTQVFGAGPETSQGCFVHHVPRLLPRALGHVRRGGVPQRAVTHARSRRVEHAVASAVPFTSEGHCSRGRDPNGAAVGVWRERTEAVALEPPPLPRRTSWARG